MEIQLCTSLTISRFHSKVYYWWISPRELKVSSKKPGEKFTYGNDQWEAGIWVVKKLQVQRAHKNTDPTTEYTSLWTPLSKTPDIIWIWSHYLWRSFSQKRLYFIMKTIKKKIKISGLDCIASLFLWKNISVWWSSVTFYRKIPAGSLEMRWDEFHVGSYRKIQRHLSLGSSVTMASGGGPHSWQLSSVSCVLILRLNTLSYSTCFGSPSITLQIIIFIHRVSVAISSPPRASPSELPSVIKIKIAAHSEHSRDGFIQKFPIRAANGQPVHRCSHTAPVGFSDILSSMLRFKEINTLHTNLLTCAQKETCLKKGRKYNSIYFSWI